MSPLQQLLAMVDGMSEHDDDYREVRAMKRLAHEVKQEDK
ncbi:hypothetical protein PP637_gp57 [Arthrobacter phage Persistence]|uniref:Uncharacterized protein n=1 Tax=Arthrobacter phage Persistence TaxID=2836007 RepID=A0A8F3E628_9CAUD|nr:hypothetical protein PP637_gp57 [Arthrobacter phage Persistence]QWY79686.1 hypothetical protein SEA_PERSISTENCE_57 [Arthrobacter phage Persistence]